MPATYVDEFTRSFNLDPNTTALVIVDMQYASGSRDYGLGRMLREQGRLEEADYRFDRIDNVIVPNTKKLLDHFRSSGSAVIHVVLGPANSDFSDAPRHLKAWFKATNNYVGTKEHEVVEALKPAKDELVVRKTTMGAFSSTGIDMALKSMGIEALVVCGVSTNNCVGMTAQEAADRQYGVVMVSDATGTCSDEMQAASLKTWQRLWGRVMTSDDVISEMSEHMPLASTA